MALAALAAARGHGRSAARRTGGDSRVKRPRMLIAERDAFSGLPALRAKYAAGSAALRRPPGLGPHLAADRRRSVRPPRPRRPPRRSPRPTQGLGSLHAHRAAEPGLRLALRLPGLRRRAQGRGGGRPPGRGREDDGPPVAGRSRPGLVPQPHGARAGARRVRPDRDRRAPLRRGRGGAAARARPAAPSTTSSRPPTS